MKVLVTGSKGMVGSAVKDFFIEKGESVYALSREELDITAREKVIETIRMINPDILIHCAAFTDVDGCTLNPKKAYLVNAMGTQNVVEGCSSVNCKMVYFSTDFVFDGKKTTPYSEADIPNPLSVYGQTKLLGEYYVSHILRDFLIIRISRVFGEKGRNFASSLPILMKKERKILLTSNIVNSPTYVVDLVNALDFLIKKGCRGIVNVCNKGECSWYEYGLKVKEIIGAVDVEIVPVEFENFSNKKAERPRYSVLDTTLLESLGFSMPEWEKSLKIYLRDMFLS